MRGEETTTPEFVDVGTDWVWSTQDRLVYLVSVGVLYGYSPLHVGVLNVLLMGLTHWGLLIIFGVRWWTWCSRQNTILFKLWHLRHLRHRRKWYLFLSSWVAHDLPWDVLKWFFAWILQVLAHLLGISRRRYSSIWTLGSHWVTRWSLRNGLPKITCLRLIEFLLTIVDPWVI